MKTLIAASLLLVLASPAHAATAKPQDWPDIREWQDNYWYCSRGTFPEDEQGHDPGDVHPERDKVCAKAVKLEKKLTAKGYCTYGRGGIGRPSMDRKHCYWIDNLPAD